MMAATAPHPESIEAIADRLRRTREAMGFSQAAWCRLTGIAPNAWNNYERARDRISIDSAVKVCQATGITMDWIYRGLMNTGLPMNIQAELQKKR